MAQWEQISSTFKSVSLQSTPPPAQWEQISSHYVSVPLGTTPSTGWQKLTQGQSFEVPQGFSIPTDFQLVDEEIFPDGEDYNGPAQRCTASFTFAPSNWPGVKWFIDKLFASKLKNAIADSGEKILTYKLYEKGFDYYIVIEATDSPSTYVGLAWAPVIMAALVVAGLIVLFLTITSIENFVYKNKDKVTQWGLIALGIAGVTVIGIALFKNPSSQAQKKPT